MDILYISCHEGLEAQEAKILTNLGHRVFCVGHYVDTRSPIKPNQTAELPFYQDWFEQFCKLHDITLIQKKLGGLICGDRPPYVFRLRKEFVDNFDAVVVGYYEENVTLNWEAIKDKLVVLRRISQIPYHISPYRNRVRIIHMAACEERMHNKKPDALIVHAIDTNFHSGYIGGTDLVLCVNKWLKDRGHVSGFEFFEAVTKGFNRLACGFGNDNLTYGKSNLTQEEIQHYRQTCGVYWASCSKPGNITYAFCEALSSGCPLVTMGPKHGNLPGYSNYDAHSYIKQGVNGFWSDDSNECREHITFLLNNPAKAKLIGDNARLTAIKNFSLERASRDWKLFLDTYV